MTHDPRLYYVYSRFGFANEQLLASSPYYGAAKAEADRHHDFPDVRVWTFTHEGEAQDVYLPSKTTAM